MKEVEKYFDEAEEDRAFRGREGESGVEAYAEYVLAKLDAPRGAAVLDFGCGDGKVLARIKERRPDLDCHGVDLSGGAIERARGASAGTEGLRYDAGDVLEGDAFLGEYDRIFSFSVLQYVESAKLGTLFRVLGGHLKAGGAMWHLSVPDARKRWSLWLNDFQDRNEGGAVRDGLQDTYLYLVHLWRIAKGDRRFGSDGISYFHEEGEVRRSAGEEFEAEVIRPSDSWYRFDVRLAKRE